MLSMLDAQRPGRIGRFAQRKIARKGLRPRYAAFAIAAFWLLAVVVFGVVERLVDPHTFKSVWLAFWWAIETVTTVGYGDIVPDQTAGKVIAAFLMLGGLSLLAIVTAVVTSEFVARRQRELQATGQDPVVEQLDAIAARLESVEAELRRLQGDPEPPVHD